MLLVLAFITMLLVTFAIIAVFLRATPDQKAMDRRIAMIKASGTDAQLGGKGLDQLLKATSTSSFDWLEGMLHSYSFSKQMQLLILQANSTSTIGALIARSAIAAFFGFLVCYLFLPSAFIAMLTALVVAYVPTLFLIMRRKKRIAAFNAALPDAVDMMARALRAGHSVVASLSMIAEQAAEPAKSEFGEVFKKQNYGLPLRDALMQLLDRVPSQDLRVLVTAMLVQKDTGGNLAEILDRTVHVIRQRLRIQGEIRVHTAQGRMTGWILCLLPVVMMVLLNVINPGYSRVLFDDPMGQKLMYVGVGLLVVGGLIIRKIVNGIEI